MQLNPVTEKLQWFERLAEQHIVTQNIVDPCQDYKNITWEVLRTDLIHPVCSGNKFFKLKYYLLDALLNRHTRITTYGGAWSNHIVASAYAANYCGLKSTGIIRGETPKILSDTLVRAKEEGMELEFLSRQDYSVLNSAKNHCEDDIILLESDPLKLNLLVEPPNSEDYIIPQGGYGILGVKGAAEMLNYTNKEKYTHICCACGTGTMLAGLMTAASSPAQQFVGIAVLNDTGLTMNVKNLIQMLPVPGFHISFDYQFGGYAKKTEDLISFMNSFYQLHHIPTDFVYTAKLMFAISDLIKKDYFPPGSRILTIHSGGLQGNKSLKKGTLLY